MATNEKLPAKSRPAANSAPISIQAEIRDERAEAAAAEPVEGKAVVVGVVATLGASPSFNSPGVKKSDAEFDLSAWPLKTLDLFSENAAAVLDLAVALGKAKSLSDAIELQSHFVSERYSTFLRQTNEIAELTRRFTFDASAPVRLSFSTFMA